MAVWDRVLMRLGRIWLLLALLGLTGATGCTGGYFSPLARHLSPDAAEALTTIKIGMTRQEVIALLGEPQRQETIGKTELLTYRPSLHAREAMNFSPVGIVEGKVAGLGPAFEYQVKQGFKAATAGK
jgi:hypothetical protein